MILTLSLSSAGCAPLASPDEDPRATSGHPSLASQASSATRRRTFALTGAEVENGRHDAFVLAPSAAEPLLDGGDPTSLTRAFLRTAPDIYDFVVFFFRDPGPYPTYSYTVYLPDQGVFSPPVLDHRLEAGASQRLLGGYIDNFDFSRFHRSSSIAGPDSLMTWVFHDLSFHELFHRWGATIQGEPLASAIPDGIHWQQFTGSFVSAGFPRWKLSASDDGSYWATKNCFAPIAHDFDLYSAGFLAANEVTERLVRSAASNSWPGIGRCNERTAVPPSTIARTFSISDVITQLGPRIPDAATAQRDFSAAFVLVLPPGESPTSTELDSIDWFSAKFPLLWSRATRARSTLNGVVASNDDPPLSIQNLETSANTQGFRVRLETDEPAVAYVIYDGESSSRSFIWPQHATMPLPLSNTHCLSIPASAPTGLVESGAYTMQLVLIDARYRVTTQDLGVHRVEGSDDTTCPPAFGNRGHSVVTRLGSGGQSNPTVTSADDGDRVTIKLLPNLGNTVTQASGCGGTLSGMAYTTAPLTEDCVVDVTFGPSTQTFPLTVTVIPGGCEGPTVTNRINTTGIMCPPDCTETYASGEVTYIEADVPSGCRFVGFSGDCVNVGGACPLNMAAARNVTATFEAVQAVCSIVLDGTGTGRVTSNPAGIQCPPTCSYTFNPGTSISLQAVADSGSEFKYWRHNPVLNTPGIATSVDRELTIAATFDVVGTTAMTVVRSGDGTVAGAGGAIQCGQVCETAVPIGQPFTLRATPAQGYTFGGWGGACASAGTNPTCSEIASDDVTVAASFIPEGRVLISSTGPGKVTGLGFDCGSDCQETFNLRTTVVLTATPQPDAVFLGWSGACDDTSTTCTVFVLGGTTVGARFVEAPRAQAEPGETDEGHSGRTNLLIPVSLSATAQVRTTLAYVTLDDTAVAGEDYVAASGTLVFQPGETTQHVSIEVIGDDTPESDERLAVHFSDPHNAILAIDTTFGVIRDDDTPRPDAGASDAATGADGGSHEDAESDATSPTPPSRDAAPMETDAADAGVGRDGDTGLEDGRMDAGIGARDEVSGHIGCSTSHHTPATTEDVVWSSWVLCALLFMRRRERKRSRS